MLSPSVMIVNTYENNDTTASSFFEIGLSPIVLIAAFDLRRFPSDPLHPGYVLKGVAIGVMPAPMAYRGSRSSRTYDRTCR